MSSVYICICIWFLEAIGHGHEAVLRDFSGIPIMTDTDVTPLIDFEVNYSVAIPDYSA